MSVYRVIDIKGTPSPPIEERELYQLIRDGKVLPKTLIDYDGRFLPAGQIPTLAPIFRETGAMPVSPGMVSHAQSSPPKRLTTTSWGCIIAIALFLFAGFLVQVLDTSEFKPVAGNCYSGVVVYYGDGKTFTPFFTILGGNEAGTTLLVEMKYNAGESTESRRYITSNKNFYVRKDDPAIKEARWMHTDWP